MIFLLHRDRLLFARRFVIAIGWDFLLKDQFGQPARTTSGDANPVVCTDDLLHVAISLVADLYEFTIGGEWHI
jgi:hypothetical protein